MIIRAVLSVLALVWSISLAQAEECYSASE